jgi:hypothetical protein
MNANDAAIDAATEAAEAQCESRLPFVELDPENPDMPLAVWSVTESGDHDADSATGIVYADALLRRSKQHDPLIGREALMAVLTAIVDKGRAGPIERGFLYRIAVVAMAGSQN